jgi:uncharacterized protein
MPDVPRGDDPRGNRVSSPLPALGVSWLVSLAGWVAVLMVGESLANHHLPWWAAHWGQGLVLCVLAGAIVEVASRRSFGSSAFSRGSVLGLDGPRSAWLSLGTGALIWTSFAAAGVVVGRALGGLPIYTVVPIGLQFGPWLLVLGGVFLMEAFPEEVIFRGYIQEALRERLGRWPGVAVQALLFTAFGLSVGVLVGAVDPLGDWSILLDRAVLFLTMGVTLGALKEWSGSLWVCIGWHLAFQTVMQGMARGMNFGLEPLAPEAFGAFQLWVWAGAMVLGLGVAVAGAHWSPAAHRTVVHRSPPRM